MMRILATTSPAVDLAVWIPTLPFLAMLACGVLCCIRTAEAKAAAGWVTVGAIAGSFLVSLIVWAGMDAAAMREGVSVHFFEWINIGAFSGNFSFFLDALTIIMLMVVTGIGLLIAIYAMGYMHGDAGYARFFAYIALFLFAMTCLVMADNLLLLFLGWEGVGLASYLLIGYYYRKPTAVAAAKKAFIVNRVGDFGFALGLIATFIVFGSITYEQVLANANEGYLAGLEGWRQTLAWWIPILLMLGAFGKSAQVPLHVWLPDAMEGPTPVSALIHAATMVTAGVYMIARLIGLFQLNELALWIVAAVGAFTAIFAATIALCQYDLKRVWAYSTLSQLGYMFLGVGLLSTTGAIFHLFTHAFFKALLFLTAGSVMHAMAGQLDLRKMSGLHAKMPVTSILMLIGCLALAGFPFITAGFYSKDMILADALVVAPVLGVIGLVTALLTAFYTFRVWFRVFLGPIEYEMGAEHHGYPIDEAPLAEELAAEQPHHAPAAGLHPHEPHEAPWWPMNGPLVILAVGAIFAGLAYPAFISTLETGSTAAVTEAERAAAVGMTVDAYHHAHDTAHTVVTWVAGLGAVLLILVAAYFHWLRRDVTERLAARATGAIAFLHEAYRVDRLYEVAVRLPMRVAAWACYMFDRVVIDGLIVDTLLGRSPHWVGSAGRMMQRGFLQGYALRMTAAAAVILLLVIWIAMWGPR